MLIIRYISHLWVKVSIESRPYNSLWFLTANYSSATLSFLLYGIGCWLNKTGCWLKCGCLCHFLTHFQLNFYLILQSINTVNKSFAPLQVTVNRRHYGRQRAGIISAPHTYASLRCTGLLIIGVLQTPGCLPQT